MKETWEYNGKKFEWGDSTLEPGNDLGCDAANGRYVACRICPHAGDLFNPKGDGKCFPGAWKEIRGEK